MSGGHGRRHLVDLVVHLARRQIDSQHRLTLLGWLWPLARQLAQLAVLVFLFSKVLELDIEDYALFVFTGLLIWGWFSSSLTLGTASLTANRHLVSTPRFPDVALPLVAVAATVVDLLLALPILLIMLALDGRLEASALLFPVVLVALFAFSAGLAMAASAINVFFRDVANIVGVALLALFYLTPVFFDLSNVPERFTWVLEANPMTHFVSAGRDVLFDGRLPDTGTAIAVLAMGPLAALLGFAIFRRLQHGFVDEL